MKNPKKKICMVTTYPVDFDNRILNEAKTLAPYFQVTILARKGEVTSKQKAPYRIKRIAFTKLGWHQLSIFSAMWGLMKAAFRENPDIYHAHDLSGLLCAYLPARFKRKILIYDSHELWSGQYHFKNFRGIHWLLNSLERILMGRVEKGITVNESLAKILKDKYHKEFLPLHLYPTLSEFSSKKSLSLRQQFKGEIIILHIGSTGEGRGAEEIIEAGKFLPAGLVIVFLGAEKRREMLEKMIKDLDLEKKVFLLSSVPFSSVITVARQADLGLVLTQNVSLSYYYSSPNKLYQYIAAEIPILGSFLPEHKKIILKNGLGELVDQTKPKLIARKILEMVKEKNQKKYRQNLKNLARKKFNWEIEAKKLIDFYRDLNLD